MERGRILLVSLSNIGDAIMTTPVLQALHAMYPAADIDIVADKRSSDVFLHCPYRGRIIHKNKQGLLRGSVSLLVELRRTRYKLVVDLRTELIAYGLKAERRLCKWQGRPYGAHAVERHMGVIHSLHGERPIPSCIIWPGEEDTNYARQALHGHSGKKLLGIGPGANWPGKIWPQENYLGLIECLQKKFEAVVLLGDEKDRDIARPIAENSALPCINLCGKTTLLQAAAVLREMVLFVGNDSGLGHMASGVNTPIITIFGPGDPARYRPWGPACRCATVSSTDINTVTVESVREQLALMERQQGHNVTMHGA